MTEDDLKASGSTSDLKASLDEKRKMPSTNRRGAMLSMPLTNLRAS